MDHAKPESQQQEQVSTQPETTADTLEGQEGVPAAATAAEPSGPEVTSWGEGQFGPIVPLRTPLTTFESSSQMGASALAPGQRRIQPHVVVRSQAEQQGTLQLSPMEWPMPGEFYPRNRRQYSQESKSPPQQQQSVTESPGTVQGDDNDCTVQCTQADTSLEPEQHTEGNSNSSTQEIIHDGEVSGTQEVTHDVKLSVENEATSDTCSQKEESIEDGCEKENTRSVAGCSQSNLCAEPTNPCPQPSSSDQAIEDRASSGGSTPTLIPDDCRSDPGSSSESVTTVQAAESELPEIDLSAGGIFRPTKSVIAPNHWGTHTYPSSVMYCHVPYENFIGCVPNMAPPNNFPPSPLTQETASVQEQYRSTFLPRIAKKGLFLRHDPPYSNNYPDVHNNPPMYAVRPPYYAHAAQHSQMNYIPVPPNQQWRTAQQWEQMVQSQQAVSQQDLSGLQQQNMMQGQQGVFLHQVPDTDHFAVQQIHPMAHQVHYPPITQQQHYPSVPHQTQTSQRGVFMNQVPITEQIAVPQEHTPVPQQSHVVMLPQGPPVSQQSYTMQYPPPSTHYKVQNSMQATAPQQYPPAISHPRLQLQHQQQLPSTQNEQTSSQPSRAPHQYQPVSQQQQQQKLQSEVPVNYTITDTTPQPSAIQSQQGLMQHRPPVSQNLPVPQHHLPVADQQNHAADQHNHAADQELPIHPKNMAVAEHQNVLQTPKMSPETEERQAGGAEETHGLERPARPRRPWVSEVEAAMIYEQATVSSVEPVLSATPPTIPLQPDFSRPPPPIEYLATALGVNQPSKPPQQHRADGAQWPEQYQVPPRLLNNHNGNKQWTNPPPLGIPSRRGRGGFYTTNIGQPIRGRGARFPGRSDGESIQRFSGFQNQHLHVNGRGPGSIPHSHISRNDTVPTISNNCIPFEEHPKNNSKDSQKELPCQEEQNTNRDRSNMDQRNSGGRNNHRGNYIPFHHGHRPHRGAYPGRNTYHQRRDIRPTATTDNTKTNQPSTTSNHDT